MKILSRFYQKWIVERIKGRNTLLAISIGVVYLWFGFLKFFPEVSPAEGLAKNTIHALTFGFIGDQVSIILLAILEVGIGLLFVLNIFKKTAIYVALIHMACTFTPFLLFVEDSFVAAPFIPTLLGQYIGKNIIIVGALLTLLYTGTSTSRQNGLNKKKGK
ncbi:hypothetical protein [Pelagihabitans pacificus]|uniref:hypothetical protein n=1 Tax=Pelagihabitans pacificus TaxID=2696054 RepID=UPI001EE7F138|nr:hypothetical protein [Pelagihabitans pacificus]